MAIYHTEHKVTQVTPEAQIGKQDNWKDIQRYVKNDRLRSKREWAGLICFFCSDLGRIGQWRGQAPNLAGVPCGDPFKPLMFHASGFWN